MKPRKWRPGDLGRFACESPKQPRFELLGRADEGVRLWYSGQSEPTVIPIKTFAADCANWWEIQKVGEWPAWARKGARIVLTGPAARHVLVSKVPHGGDRPWLETRQTINVHGCELEMRTVRYDYASALVVDTSALVILPLGTVEQGGQVVRNLWSRLDEGDDYAPDPHAELLAQFDDA